MVDSLRRRGVLARVLFAFAAIYFVWGSTFLAIRVAIEHIPPLLMCGARLLSAGLVLVVWAHAAGEAWPRGLQWRNAVVIGLMLPAIGNGSVTLGETHVASGLVALLVASIPLWMALLGAVGPDAVRPAPRAQLGLLLGLGGIALLIGPGIAGPAGTHHSPLWALVPVAGSLSWAWGSLWSRRAGTSAAPRMATGVGLVAGGVALLVASALAGEPARFDPAQVTLASAAALAYLSVFGSVIAFSAYLYLLRTVSPGNVATYAFVNPVVALALGWVFAGEALSVRTLVAAGLVLVSVVLITTSHPTAARSVARPLAREQEEEPA